MSLGPVGAGAGAGEGEGEGESLADALGARSDGDGATGDRGDAASGEEAGDPGARSGVNESPDSGGGAGAASGELEAKTDCTTSRKIMAVNRIFAIGDKVDLAEMRLKYF